MPKERHTSLFNDIPSIAAHPARNLDFGIEPSAYDVRHVTHSVRIRDSRVMVLLQQTVPFLADCPTHRQFESYHANGHLTISEMAP